MAGRQSLGEFLSSSGLTMASFAGLTLRDALDRAGLTTVAGSFSRDRSATGAWHGDHCGS